MNHRNHRTNENESIKDFKELTVQELIKGYVRITETDEYICIFCGESFEEGVIYSETGRLLTAKRGAAEHVKSQHGGSFGALTSLDKQICGLSDIQKSIMTNMYEENDNKTICENMGISAATVRTHKFNLQKAKREAKILLALMEILEDENLWAKDNSSDKGTKSGVQIAKEETGAFEGNSLHPFFTQYRYK